MPTNILRKRGSKISAKDAPAKASGDAGRLPVRTVAITIGGHTFSATLLDTPIAGRIWAALPLYSSAETWGQAIHFEVPVESGRERGATLKAERGTLYFWSDEHRVILAFGATPLARDGEMRLPVPCNAWAATETDLSILAAVTPGAKVSVVRR
ncbi:MAG: cyclophilin-like fold protein [Hyphomicrobiaceae bacterium]|nr:cyclophilin-like fold protein [Hyphomicrobiaceae bacterium]